MGKKVVRRVQREPLTDARGIRSLLERASQVEGNLFEEGGPPEEVVVGIDASLTKYGISVYAPNSGRHATILFKPKYRGARRLLEIWEFVSLLVNVIERNFEVQEYTMEAYAMGIRGGQVFSIGEGGGATKLALVQRYGVEDPIAYPTLVSPSALKKFVTSKGTAKKNEILLGVYRKWGIDFGGQDDMADAYGLARIAAALLSGTEHAYEEEVVNALERNTEWAPRS